MKRKLLVLVLAVACMMTSVLAGCGKKADTPVEESKSAETTKSEEASKEVKSSEADTEEIDVSNIVTKATSTCFIAGDAAYEYYTFVQQHADTYSDLVKEASTIVGDSADVYTLLIPTGMDITLPAAIRETITNTSDQAEAIKYMYDRIGDSATNVWVMDNLKAHKSEYLYFRTDHHWTALGAYYAYEELAKAMGIEANDIKDFESVSFDGFLGSFYQHSEEEALTQNPDTVVAYVPKGTNDLTYTDKDGNVVKWKIIKDVSNWNAATKYNTFISGDNPYVVINNPKITDGSSCLVLKESQGNALVPFLVDHYQTVHVIDYRYTKDTLSNFISENDVDDVFFFNFLGAAISSTNTQKMANFVK